MISYHVVLDIISGESAATSRIECSVCVVFFNAQARGLAMCGYFHNGGNQIRCFSGVKKASKPKLLAG